MSEISEEEKAVYQRASERRKAAGIKLKRFCVQADENQVKSLNEIWDFFVIRFGKQHAVDHVVSMLGSVVARMKDKERASEAGSPVDGSCELSRP